ncbi:MAG: NfeD family protein, partial [Acidobacteria bacterium]|nr:NfeD family protein [Acidobacteriota bacterium]
LWFGIGALCAALGGFLGLAYPLQFLIFFVVSIALTAASRTIFSNFFTHKELPDGLRSGAAGLPGQIGTVVTSSRGALNEGAVKVYGSIWTAYPAEGEEPLEAGERVVVERLQGASIYVRRAGTIPEWRVRELSEGGESPETGS